MKKYFCDRCGKETNTMLFQYEYKYDSGMRGTKFTGEIKKDFCSKCMKVVVKVIEGKEKESENNI